MNKIPCLVPIDKNDCLSNFSLSFDDKASIIESVTKKVALSFFRFFLIFIETITTLIESKSI